MPYFNTMPAMPACVCVCVGGGGGSVCGVLDIADDLERVIYTYVHTY